MLNPDYRDMLSAFADAEVEYLAIGAYALAAHGHPRATGDVDLWVRRSSENAERMKVEIEGLTIPVLGRTHLIQNKRVLGRLQD